MGHSLGAYAHEPSGLFSRERHNFGPISCIVDRDGSILRIERGNETLAEDGIFGEPAIRIRDEAELLHSIIIANERAERDAAIEAARRTFERERQAQRDRFTDIENEAGAHLESLIAQLRQGSVDLEAASYLGLPENYLSRALEDEFFQGLREDFEAEAEEAARHAGAESARAEAEEREAESIPDRTELSVLAERVLRHRQPACDLVSSLGEPDWVIFSSEHDYYAPADAGIQVFSWENGQCAPVSVDIEVATGEVIGWSEGRQCYSQEEVSLFHPSDTFRAGRDRNSGC